MANYTERSFIHLIDHAIVEKYRTGEWIPEPSTGQIFSRKTMNALKPSLSKDGYLQITTNYRSPHLRVGIGRAVWVMVNGAPLDASLEVDHINRIKTDNRLVNLRLVTASENKRNRTVTKIDMQTAEKIRADFAAGGVTMQALASAYHCSHTTVARIVRYQTLIPAAGGETDDGC